MDRMDPQTDTTSWAVDGQRAPLVKKPWAPPELMELPRLTDLTLQTGSPIDGGGDTGGGVVHLGPIIGHGAAPSKRGYIPHRACSPLLSQTCSAPSANGMKS